MVVSDFERLANALKRMTFSGKQYAETAHKYLFKHLDETSSKSEHRNHLKAVANLNMATSYMTGAYSFYHTNYETICHDDIDDVFHKYFAFANELMTNFTTEHSHQWSDIEYDRFPQAFENSVLNCPCSD